MNGFRLISYCNFFVLLVVLLPISCEKSSADVDSKVDTYSYPEGKIYLEYPPAGLDGIAKFEPRGYVDVFPKPHAGAFLKHPVQMPTTTPVYAMADGQIIGLGEWDTDTPEGVLQEHTIVIKHSTTMTVKYGHVGRLSQKIKAQLPPLDYRSDNDLSIPISAGDTIAYVFGYSALDILLMDESLQLDYLYPEVGPEARYSASLPDYFKEPLRSTLLSMSLREEEPRWGKIVYDIAGKLIGNWYFTGDFDDVHSEHLAIAYNHVQPSRIAFSDGYANYDLGIRGSYGVLDNEPKPETIGPESGMIKYEVFLFSPFDRQSDGTIGLNDLSNIDDNAQSKGTYLLNMLDSETLKIELFLGQKPDEVTDFTENSRIYKRKPR